MKLINYRGKRSKKYHQKMKLVVYIILMIPFLVLNGLFYWKYYEQFSDDPIRYGVIGAVLFIVPLFFVFFIEHILFMKSLFFNKLNNLRVLSNFLIENQFYISKKNANNKERIKLPKVYMKQDRFGVDVTFPLQGNKFQDRFIKLESTLEIMFDGDFMNKTYTKGFVTYRIATDQFSGRINIDEVKVTKKGLKLMDDVYWDFISEPHLLISGGTGGGKTIALMTIIKGLAEVGIVEINDPKQSDFVGLKDIPLFGGKVYFTKDDMIQSLKTNVDEMNQRYRDMTNHPEYRAGKKYFEYGFLPKFLVFDEWAAFMATLENDYQNRELVMEYLTQLILKGRQAGYFVILAMQRADGEFIKTSLRDQFMKKLSVGHLEDTGYTMMFGDANKNKEFKKIDKIDGKKIYGRGYIATSGEVAREFYSPYVPLDEGFDFLEEFQKMQPLINDNVELVSPEGQDDELLSVDIEEEEDLFDSTEEEPTVMDLKDFAESMDTPFSTVRKLVSLFEDNDYSFTREDNRVILDEDDIGELSYAIETKANTGKTYAQVVKEQLSD